MEKNDNRLKLCDTNGMLKQIMDILSGKNGKLWKKAISAFVQQGAIKAFGWEISKPIKLRSFESFEVLMAVVEHTKKEVKLMQSHDAPSILQRLSFPIPEEKVSFIALSVKDLGFEEITKISSIKECLSSLDLELCRDSDGAQLWLTNDPDAKAFLIRETTHCDGRALIVASRVFYVENRHKRIIPYFSQVYFISDGFMFTQYNDSINLENECDEDFELRPQDKLLFRVKKVKPEIN